MEARLKQIQGISIVELDGPIEIARTHHFRKACEIHLLTKPVIFNMQKTMFVGSTGIQDFLDTIRVLCSSQDSGLQIVGVRSEFRRMIENSGIQNIQFFESEKEALHYVQTRPEKPQTLN